MPPETSGPPVCDEDIHRFLFSSTSHLVGETQGEDYQLRVAFEAMGQRRRTLHHAPSPFKRSYFALSLRLPQEESKGNFRVIETYSWLGEQFGALLTAFFGKLIRCHGHVQQGYHITVPDLADSPNPAFRDAPFNDRPRRPNGVNLDLKEADELVRCFLYSPIERPLVSMLISSASFYQLSLENWATRPELAYTLLISAIEGLLEIDAYSDADLFDEGRLKEFSIIERTLPDGAKIVRNLRKALRSVKRKFVAFALRRLSPEFFSAFECEEEWGTIKSDAIEGALRAAYDLRSGYLHSGNLDGFELLTNPVQGAEKILGNPILDSKDRKKLLVKAPTLPGLERIVSTILRAEITEWIKKSRTFFDSEEALCEILELDYSI